MAKSEIINQIKELLESENNASSCCSQIEEFTTQFNQEKNELESQQRTAHAEQGLDPIEFIYKKDEEDVQFQDLITTFNQRLEKEKENNSSVIEEASKNKEDLLTAKNKIISKLKGIAKTDVKNLGKNFQVANQLQTEWNTLPKDKSPGASELETEYKHLLDTFYYDAKIVKDAIELDYQRNLVSKKQVIEKIKGLNQLTDARQIEQKIRQYEKEWFRVGPVKRELRDESKLELESAVKGLQPKLDILYESQGELLNENLGKKIALCEQLNEMLGRNLTSPKQYQQVADQVIALQKDWREIGRSEEQERIWEVFRGACDSFFNRKRDYFKNLASTRKENKSKKLELIKKSEAASASTDWKDTAKLMISLQNDWKQIGPAHPAEDQKLWEKFRASCDVFFNARKEHFKDRNQEYVVNLEKKKEIIKEINDLVLTGNVGKDVNNLQGFEKSYQAIGFVPFKDKDKIHKEFYDLLNKHYNSINIDRNEKDKMRYESRVQNMATGKKPEKTLNFERNKIKQELSELETKLSQYSNNIRVVSSGKDNPLVKMIEKNISDTEKEIERKKMQLELIKGAKTKKVSSEEE